MNNKYLISILRYGFVALVGATALIGCNDDNNREGNYSKSSRISVIQESFGSQTRAGASPIIQQETIDLGDGIFMDVTLQEDFGQVENEDVKTRTGLKEDTYTILGYYEDGRYAGANVGTVTYTGEGESRKGVFTFTDDFKFHNGNYDFICVNSAVELSDNRDMALVNRGKAKNTPVLISDAEKGTINNDTIDIVFTMRHKESGIRFSLNTSGEFSGVKATISTSNAKPSVHKYNLPDIELDTDAIASSEVPNVELEIEGGSQTTPYEYFLPGTDASDVTITFNEGTVWGRSLKGQSITLSSFKELLEANTRYTAIINIRDGIPAFDGIIAIGHDGKLTLTAETNQDALARTVFFKYGSVVATSSRNIAWRADEAVYNPTNPNVSFDTWASVPSDNANVVHTWESVQAGKGDPCRLVGLDATALSSSNYDNGEWRLPTQEDYVKESTLIGDWTTTGYKGNGSTDYPGRMVTIGSAPVFHPAVGYRKAEDGGFDEHKTTGLFWTNELPLDKGVRLYFKTDADGVNVIVRNLTSDPNVGSPIRCVRQSVPAAGEIPAFDHIIAIGKDGKLTVTAESQKDTEARTVFFKYGSVVAQSSINAAWAANQVMFNPTTNDNSHYAEWSNILTQNTHIIHTLASVQAGKGDPCRLVGLDVSEIKEGKIDNKVWRMPTLAEHLQATTTNSSPIKHATSSYVGKYITLKSDYIESTIFYPILGYRNAVNHDVLYPEVIGDYWSSISYNTGNGYYLRIHNDPITVGGNQTVEVALPIRCVPQVVPGTGPAGIVPAFDGVIAIGSNGRLTVTAETDEDDNARTVYFKFGGIIGFGPIKKWINEWNPEVSLAVVTFNPTGKDYSGAKWEDFPIAGANDIDESYHTHGNILLGKGDPCRLVGLSEEEVLSGARIDNGEWRMPTDSEYKTRVIEDEKVEMYKNTEYYMKTVKMTINDKNVAYHYPLLGRIWSLSAPQDLHVNGNYWSGSRNGNENSYRFLFERKGDSITSQYVSCGQVAGFTIRCVPQVKK